MNIYKCVVCGNIYKTNSTKRPYCSENCKGLYNPIKHGTKPLSTIKNNNNKAQNKKSEDIKKNTKSDSEEKIKKAVVKSKSIPYEKLKKMTWDEKYKKVDSITKVSMLSKALCENGEMYSYGELKQLQSINPEKYTALEKRVLESKKGAPGFERW